VAETLLRKKNLQVLVRNKGGGIVGHGGPKMVNHSSKTTRWGGRGIMGGGPGTTVTNFVNVKGKETNQSLHKKTDLIVYETAIRNKAEGT